MNKVNVKVQKLSHFDPSFELPFYASSQAAGADLRACFENKETLEVPSFGRVLIPTGLSFEIAKGYEVQVRPRSGMSLKTGFMVANSPGTIDSDYRGEIKVILVNLSEHAQRVEHGQRVAQLVISPVFQIQWQEVQSFETTTDRGAGGFGSTGV
jgi:dUTP pyrophosphatase